MTVPVVEGSATSTDSDRSTTTLSMNIPTFVVLNEVLFASVTVDDTASGAISFPAGWTEILDESNSSNTVATYAAWKLADGTETGTISVTVPDKSTCGIMYRISGAANPNFEPPLFDTTTYTGTSQPVGRRLLGRDLESNDFLSFCLAHRGEVSSTVDNYPHNYTGTGNLQGTAGQMWYSHRNVQSPMELSGTWGFSSSTGTVTSVVMFYPASKLVQTGNHPYIRAVGRTFDSHKPSSTTCNLQLPKIIYTGDVLIAWITQFDAASDAVTWPSGWTELYDDSADATVGFTTYTMACSAAWRKADGSEGPTVLIPVVAAEPLCAVCVSIGGAADPTLTPPEGSFADNATGSDWNAPTVTPTGGSDDYLWLAGGHLGSQAAWPEDFPSSYEDRVESHTNVDPAVDDSKMIVSWRRYTTTSQNPTPATTTVVLAPVGASTIAVYPGEFTNGEWWYQNRYDKSRGGYM